MGFFLVVPAAGSGSRLGGQPKQFRLLGNRPVLVQTIRPFVDHPDLEGVVVATSRDVLAETKAMLASEGWSVDCRVIEGGETRQESVFRALVAAEGSSETVLIHDAVRPFVTSKLINTVLEAAESVGAACPAVPVADTLRRVATDCFTETVDRKGLYAAQTPQGFSLAQILEAHHKGLAGGRHATDDVELYQAYIGNVAFVDGSTHNFKITRTEDWDMAEKLWGHVRDEVRR